MTNLVAQEITLEELIELSESVDDVHPNGDLRSIDELAKEYAAINELAKQHGLEEEWEAWCIAYGCA